MSSLGRETTRAQSREKLRKNVIGVIMEHIIHYYVAIILPVTDYLGFACSLSGKKLIYKTQNFKQGEYFEK